MCLFSVGKLLYVYILCYYFACILLHLCWLGAAWAAPGSRHGPLSSCAGCLVYAGGFAVCVCVGKLRYACCISFIFPVIYCHGAFSYTFTSCWSWYGPLLGRGMGRSVAAGCGVYAWCLGSKQSVLGVTPLCVCTAYRLVSEMLPMSIDDDAGGDYKCES